MEYLTFETFKQKVFNFELNNEWKFEGDKPVICEFFASWCQPCKMVAPILEQITDEHPEIDVYKINIEEQQELAGMFGIRSIPSILFISKDGRAQMTTGALPKQTFEEIISKIF